MSTTPVKVAVTGAAGQIGYSLLFRIASGALLGPDSRSSCGCSRSRRRSVPPRAWRWSSTTARSRCCAGVEISDDPNVAFDGVNIAPAGRARARAKRAWSAATCWRPTARSSRPQGKALTEQRRRRRAGPGGRQPGEHQRADRDEQRARHPARAVHRDDPARPQPGHRAAGGARPAAPVNAITQMTIWGNHSATQYPDLFHAEVDGQNAAEVVDDQAWLESDFIPTVQKRGAAIIEARGSRRAASAANAAIDHVRDWVLGTADGDWVSMAVPSDGSYGVPEGLMSSFPCTSARRRSRDRPGPRDRRLLPRPDRRLRGRAGRGARRRRGARADRLTGAPRPGAIGPGCP